jgi:hypothetical protein
MTAAPAMHNAANRKPNTWCKTDIMPLLRRLALPSLASVLTLAVAIGCGSSKTSRNPDRDDRDGGDGGAGSGGRASGGTSSGGIRSSGGTSSGGTSSGGAATSTGGAPSTGGVVGTGGTASPSDAGPDASEDGGPSPTTDSGAETGTADAGPLNALFAHINGILVRVNPETGALTEVGPTGQGYIVLTWDHVAKVVRVISDPYSPVGGAAAPRLGVMNLCTGVITGATPLTVGTTAVRRAEGLAQHPDTGAFWITYGVTGTGAPQQYLTEANGTVDIATGAVTFVGNHQTLQDDGDLLLFLGSTLQLLDIAVGSNAGSLYTVNQTTGAVTVRANVGPTVVRVAQDPTRNLLFGMVGGGSTSSLSRGLVIVNPDTGANTPVGPRLPDATYQGQAFTSLISVPEPGCS